MPTDTDVPSTPTEPEKTVPQDALRWLSCKDGDLTAAERRVVEHLLRRQTIARQPEGESEGERAPTFGERMADQVARFGGSWMFITAFLAFLVAWVGLNLAFETRALDPYPFIFLNLLLSMLAALQAPVIMMSQNRQAAKDRAAAAHDYEVNLKAEMDIMGLHEKMDDMRTRQLEGLIARQQAQIDSLIALLHKNGQQAPSDSTAPTT
ncbi:DUF1003 domain-containing protein [Paracoccus suum]|uniref:DUF1003 domain-containing protein n=1 Tax=Paracoccus suum TaxID=2259340 RepID=A0A344PIY7_9RHOB|nr:DUF1003 domain-containing protein [Paracoccus suum]AXC49342.1 DUF1003 domain-containing protein [Paracoccus suum]